MGDGDLNSNPSDFAAGISTAQSYFVNLGLLGFSANMSFILTGVHYGGNCEMTSSLSLITSQN